jgi:putative glutamine amidotransferase
MTDIPPPASGVKGRVSRPIRDTASVYDSRVERPRIVVTLSNPERAADPSVARLKNERYCEAVDRAGGVPLAVDDTTPADELEQALRDMDGLVISGGADIDPGLYGEAPAGSHAPDPGRDGLDLGAFRAATHRAVPVLGVCRGMQAINAFSGGTLLQDVDEHESVPYPQGPARQHAVDVIEGSRLSSIVGGEPLLVVNSYHHQAVTPDRLAAGLRASATADHDGGLLVEALETRDPARWLVGIQCHPERTESSPLVLERLWTAFVAAAAAARRSTAAAEAD